MQDDHDSNPANESPLPCADPVTDDVRERRDGYSPFQISYMGLMALVVLTVLSAGGWGTWRYMTHGFMSFEVEELVDAIETGDEVEAELAANQIIDIGYGAEAAIPFLVDMVANPDMPNRVAAAKTLGGLYASSPEAVNVLGDAARDGDEAVRHAALDALSQIGPPAETVLPVILEQLDSGDSKSRQLAARVLGNIGYLEIEAEDALVAALEDSEPGVRAAALSALVQTGAELPEGSIAKLAEFLTARDAETRADAVLALGQLGPEAAEAVSAIEIALADESSDIRHSAAWALGNMGEEQGARAVPPLATVLETDTDADVRAQAAWALGQMGLAAEPAAGALLAALEDPEDMVQLEAYEALKKILKAKGEDFNGISEALDNHRLHAGNCGHHDVEGAEDEESGQEYLDELAGQPHG
ncbi:MAG: HEAT repeat domain-containing protein [Pseudomonadota bacterium]